MTLTRKETVLFCIVNLLNVSMCVIDAWIVTGGMHAGVMKHVGRAVRNHTLKHGNKKPIIVIGIAHWGYISNRMILVNRQVCILAV